MQRALELAGRAKGRTFPNPAVGAVIVNAGNVVGEGMTDRCGGPHAEPRALKRAGHDARGATMYVTLEPCCHYGRTPPCTDAIIAAGISRVVVAAQDPSPPMAGKGLRALRRAGIETTCGLLRDQARHLNEDFFWWVGQAKPWVSLKLAMTLDGRIADSRGMSKWITGKQSRAFVHDLRRRHAAIVVGRGTLLADDPSLTVRHVRGQSPIRMVFVRSGRVPASSAFVRTASQVRSIVVRGGSGSPRKYVRPNGLEVWDTGCMDTGCMAQAFLRMAAEEQIQSIMLEGGQ
ncbi:MAG: bifunctional diaminohydroxyphosphoribosylaminopyrimidine deaminase/5-amino-6-(5-phosphoribosylamino)uracil reductase RibD, partial [Chitinivibrionales bacterium]|nr:bifunctional diaminohydroxyphosphoribosylaminopyrimidine deaminase/5-amino-6-(5-phosphoribosylamino)uracil reductase RibD [Chitinivibrionales bacterium]